MLSASSIGRLLKQFKERGLIIPSAASIRAKWNRLFHGHAQPWRYGMKANELGQLIQIDHLVVSKNQLTLRPFQAWDHLTKTLVAEAYSNATAATVQKFLLKVINGFPFQGQSIQVDGGSEFRANFETECQQQGIQLLVLPSLNVVPHIMAGSSGLIVPYAKSFIAILSSMLTPSLR